MNLANLSIKQPVFISMLMAVLVVVGYIGYTRLSVDLFPDTSNPMVSVSTTYSGAGPAEVQRQVTQPLEDALSTLNGKDALLIAGPTRLRPILMTTMSLILGMTPVALGLGAGGSFRAPMAIAVIGGLITSTLLTLIVVPTFYNLLDMTQERLLHRTPAPQPAPTPEPASMPASK